MDQRAFRTLAFEYLPERCCIVLYQGTEPPSDAEWDAYIGQVQSVAHMHAKLKIFVFSERGRPSKDQQARLTEAASGHLSHVAVVSPAFAMRFVVSALSLFKPNLRFFTPEQLSEAFQHLGFDPAARLIVEQTIERMRRRIGKVASGARAG
jgi:hypothetical protein